MKYSAVFLVAVVLAASAAASQAQLLEECFWECSVDYCDYHDDYCNYDCHEVCYPIVKKSPLSIFDQPIDPLQQKQIAKTPIGAGPDQQETGPRPLHDQLAGLNRDQTANMDSRVDSGRIGKHVRMRIENPAYETMRRGKVVLTRGSPPKSFAMFQDCLSAAKHPDKQPDKQPDNQPDKTPGKTPGQKPGSTFTNIGDISWSK